ncbi:unnamed protein product [Sphenostylis stenocarpa]|uniref:Uncharacterized protein n=1 Tax=Sphenostylis stenocarpa TaxID=92480 RepID=A0AA86VHF5_9FABA|nr:unnamed protein product [Sphenostylis stenocarpa]
MSEVMASEVTVNSVGGVNSAPNPTKGSSTPSPTFCLLLSACNSACSAFAGSLFGYGPLSNLDLHVLSYIYNIIPF